MNPPYLHKVCTVLCIAISIKSVLSADQYNENLSKYKYGYVISHKGGSSQAHLESRDGNLALGRYYVNLPNGSGQKVTYFADDLGVHSGVFYSSHTGNGSSQTQFAMGYKALAALGNFDQPLNNIIPSSTVAPFGTKILQKVFNIPTPKPGNPPELNYTPVPGGFYLTHKSLDASKSTTNFPNYVPVTGSQAFANFDGKYSTGVPQSKATPKTFYPSSENVKNEINQLHIQSTTPSIKTYTSVSQQDSSVFGRTDETKQFSEEGRPVSSYVREPENLTFYKQKSIEKTNFADIDARLISEVQKHAEEIILKDLQKQQNINIQNEFSRFTPDVHQISTVTMQPIVVSSGSGIDIANTVSSTQSPEVNKYNKDFQTGSINSIQITEKSNSDQKLEDTGYFRVSLSPSLTSSSNVTQAPSQEFIDVKSTDRNSNDCESHLCEKYSNQEFTNTAGSLTKQIDELDPLQADVAAKSDTNKITQTFYPKNENSKESHYVTTIDVQKGIALDVQQNEDGSIQLAANFPFNKVTPYQNQYAKQTAQPLIVNSAPVTPSLFTPAPAFNLFNTPQKSYVLNAVTLAPGLFDVVPNQNLGILQGYNDILPSQNGYAPNVQDRIENQRFNYENQLTPPTVMIPGPSGVPAGQNANDLRINQDSDLKQVEKNIEGLRQQILSSIDAQHEEEERRQKAVDEERKQYFENLKKVEELKDQNSISYNQAIDSHSEANVQPTVSPVTSVTEVTNSVELLPQTQYVQTEQIPTHQNEIKDFGNQVPVVYANIQPVNSEIYQKQTITYRPQEFQTTAGVRQWNQFGQNIQNQNVYADSNGQQTTDAYASQRVQLNNYAQKTGSNDLRYQVPVVPQVEEKRTQQQANLLQINTVPVNYATETITQRPQVGKTVLVNPIVPFTYGRALQAKQPVSLLQSYSVSSPSALSSIYSVPQQLVLQYPQNINFQYPTVQLREYSYSGVIPNAGSNKQYSSSLALKPTNKLRIQPLKPSVPDEDSQREAVQNIFLQQSPLQQSYYFPNFSNFPFNNRLQLRHVQKNKISNSDQVTAQSVRRGKSLKNLRIEYGFKPPLRPSVEFSEEVKPSIYGPSVPPQ